MRKSKFLSMLLALAVMTTMLLVPPPDTVLAAVDNAVPGTIYGVNQFVSSPKTLNYDSITNQPANIAEYENLGKPFGELNSFLTNDNLKYFTQDTSSITYNIEQEGNYNFYMLCVEYDAQYPKVYLDNNEVYDASQLTGYGVDPHILGYVKLDGDNNQRKLACIKLPTPFHLTAGSHTIKMEKVDTLRGLIAVNLIKNDDTQPSISFNKESDTVIKETNTYQLTANLLNISDGEDISWESTKTNVATVEATTKSSGTSTTVNITLKQAGSTDIKATYTKDDDTTATATFKLTIRNRDYGKVITLDGVSTMLTVGEDSFGDYGQNVLAYKLFGLDVFRTENLSGNDKIVKLGNVDLTNTDYDTVEVYGSNNSISKQSSDVKINIGGEEVADLTFDLTDDWNTFKSVTQQLDAVDKKSGPVTMTLSNSNSVGNYVYVRFYNSNKFPEKAEEWADLSGSDGGYGIIRSATKADDESYNLAYATNATSKGYSYNLTNKIENLPEGTAIDSFDKGTIEVTYDVNVSNPNSDTFIDLSSNDTISGWGGGNDGTYARIAFNDQWTTYVRCIGGKGGTTTSDDNNNNLGGYKTVNGHQFGEWMPVKVTIKPDKTVSINYNGTEVTPSGKATSVNGNLYLNINPSTSGGTTVEIKNIKAIYNYGFGESDTDSGYYYKTGDESTKYGVIRYLQEYVGDKAEITEYGFYFIDDAGHIINAENKHIASSKPEELNSNNGFYGDLTDITTDNFDKTIYAKAYVKVGETIYYADSIGGEVKSATAELVEEPKSE